MPSLKSLKNRIKSIRSTQKITKAMKMVAASKLKRARERAENSSQYGEYLASLVNKIVSTLDKEAMKQIPMLYGTGKKAVNLMIVITSNRGLCGAFNQNAVKFARRIIEEYEANQQQVKMICVGKKGYDLLKKKHGHLIIAHYDNIAVKGVKFEEAHGIAEKILELFEQKEFDTCTIIYNKFKSVISQVPSSKTIIPLSEDSYDNADVSACEYEPEEEEILKHLLPKNFVIQIYRSLLESNAGEQGARMTAMDNATRNSGDMIKKLNLVYNRTRQAYITKELIEIISGAEAV